MACSPSLSPKSSCCARQSVSWPGGTRPPEMLLGLLNLDDIHEACGVGGVRAHLAVHLDQALHEDGCHLTASQGIPAHQGVASSYRLLCYHMGGQRSPCRQSACGVC